MSTPVRSRSGISIQTVDDWKQHASTEGNWQPGFSAMELARLWLDGAGSQAVVDALAPALPGLVLDEAVAEEQVRFDAYAGGVRNHDVLTWGHTQAGGAVIGVEGKVDESLDATIARKYKSAEDIKQKGDNTNLDKRVDALLLAIVGRSLHDDPSLGGLRYQLFSAIAGTLAAARQDTVAAAVVIHLIRTPLAKVEKLQAARDAVADSARATGLDADGPVVGPIELNAEHAGGLAVSHSVPCWLAVVETRPLPTPSPASSRSGRSDRRSSVDRAGEWAGY